MQTIKIVSFDALFDTAKFEGRVDIVLQNGQAMSFGNLSPENYTAILETIKHPNAVWEPNYKLVALKQ